jgi:hypothetical protein
MKLNKSIYIILVIAVGFGGVTSCSKSDFDINRNPNAPTDSTITYNLLLASSLQTTASLVETQWGFLQNWLGYWARSGTYAPNVTEESYDVTNNFQTGIWDNFYSNTFNYDIMQKKAAVAGATFYEGVARIMKAHNFQILVDVYNNIPYTAALQGTQNPTPEYSNGEDVYKDLFRQLDTAITLLNETNPDLNTDYTTNDLVYGGDVTMWIKFANTLKLRMLVHVAEVPDFDIAGEVAKINATGVGYLGAGETAELNPGFNSSKPNPFYLSYVADETGAATQNAVYYKANAYAVGDGTGSPDAYGYYNWNSDPRVSRFYTAGNQGMRGVPYGLPPVTTNAAATLSSISGPGLMKNHGYDAPAWILTSVESLFLQAEAAERGIIAGDAGALTNEAITESFVWLGLSAEDATDYLTLNAGYADVDYYADGGGIVTIISQKWFALNAIATFEVWTDYRRVNYNGEGHFVYGDVSGYTPGPPISVAPQNTKTEIPIRLLYPQSEFNYNATNVQDQGTPDAFTSKIFWDVN